MERDLPPPEPLHPSSASSRPPSQGSPSRDGGRLEGELEVVRVGLLEVLDALAAQPADGASGDGLYDGGDVVGGRSRRLAELRFPHADDGLYRAQAIGGCEVFANAKYCPE